MAKILSKEELEQIERMEKAYSPKNIKSSNALLRLKTLQQRIDDIDKWREHKLLEAKLRLHQERSVEE